MAKFVKLNVQTMVGGILLGVGTYPQERINERGWKFVEAYNAEQKSLPLEKRDLPPYFEIIDTDKKVPETLNDKLNEKENAYVGLSKAELKDICKQRGIDYPSNPTNAVLISLLVEDDEKQIKSGTDWNDQFKTPEEFEQLSATEQVEYLDEIFCLPDGMEEDSEEAVKYSGDLVVVINTYAGLSLEAEAVEKVKEILAYYAEEEE